ncbi:MAG: alpha/beta hydrolase [Peptococcaceae bacterium]|nr:alpha/beta hydrolase [Peptococcaceae bacterium]
MEKATFLSADHQTEITYHLWQPADDARAVLVLFHGMLEYGERYAPFAEALNARGIIVYAPDHLGHGDSVTGPDMRGHFADRGGNACVLRDCYQMLTLAHAAHPDLPLFVMGHSMGSFLTRQLLHSYPLPALAGVLLMGTGNQPRAAVAFGKLVTGTFARIFGPRHKSPLLFKLILGSNNLRFRPRKNDYDWLSRDEFSTDAFAHNPRIVDNFTCQAYADMLGGMLTNYDPARLKMLDTTIPVFILSGAADPIGGYGKGLEQLRDDYAALGYQDLTLRLYPDARHELLNEINRDRVTADIVDWIEGRITTQA